MQDIRKQFSLDWLTGSETSQSQSSGVAGQSPLQEALLYYAAPILKRLAEAPAKEMGLHDLARAVKDEIPGFQFGQMWEVVMSLSSSSHKIEIADTSDPTGNYLIRLDSRSSAR